MNNDVKDLEIPAQKTNNYLQKNIKSFLEKGLSFEKANKIEEAIENYEKALSLYNSEKKNIEIFELYMKVGDLCQICGNIEKGLKYFEGAYTTARVLENKILQVDALVKITDSHLSKGEIEDSVRYAEITNSILSKMEYIKGKIENIRCWSRIYYIKREFYKARETCNEALRLCGDNYPFYKGRVLITLVELYKDITSVEEHLELLRQAYECFEKVNYQRGMLGVINNIATVYGDKLQDYEKTLEYLIKLKELSENSIYVEFCKISYLNIGEIYYKTFKYEEALYWFGEALKKPNGAYLDNILFYNYVYLSVLNLKLYKYQQSYDYFKKASEELNKNSCTESTLIQYYKVAALMFIEFGETNKALSFIKQALDFVEKDETMIKWNIGLVYEYVKLREAKNETDIIDILGGIRYTISKYIDKDEILDAVYDITVELISLGHCELAFNLMDEYSNMKSETDSIRLKKAYIDFKKNGINNQEDIELLKGILELAKQTNNPKIHWKLFCGIGDYYIKKSDFKNAISYFNEAYSLVEKVLLSIPETYRLQFINSSNSLEPLNKLNYAQQQINKLN